eukprot:SM000838S23175  [mRNA]  locus=s838:5:1820:+ [translate_table: standard]
MSRGPAAAAAAAAEEEAEEEEAAEHTLLVVRDVAVYRIPPRSTSAGHRSAEWLLADRIWGGRLRVLGLRAAAEIRLESTATGELFAGQPLAPHVRLTSSDGAPSRRLLPSACRVLPGSREASVESVVDSSRNFVLRIDDGAGKHAFVGLGFAERSDAFDFNVALSDHEKHLAQEAEQRRAGASGRGESSTSSASSSTAAPSSNLRLKDGETIRINVKPVLRSTPAGAGGMLSSALHNPGMAATTSGEGGLGLAPPPGHARLRQPLPPPSTDMWAGSRRPGGAGASFMPPSPSQKAAASDPFHDLSQLERSLPTAGKDGSKQNQRSGGSSWAQF